MTIYIKYNNDKYNYMKMRLKGKFIKLEGSGKKLRISYQIILFSITICLAESKQKAKVCKAFKEIFLDNIFRSGGSKLGAIYASGFYHR